MSTANRTPFIPVLVQHDEIVEIDVNPVLAGPDNVIALDGLITLTETEE